MLDGTGRREDVSHNETDLEKEERSPREREREREMSREMSK